MLHDVLLHQNNSKIGHKTLAQSIKESHSHKHTHTCCPKTWPSFYMQCKQLWNLLNVHKYHINIIKNHKDKVPLTMLTEPWRSLLALTLEHFAPRSMHSQSCGFWSKAWTSATESCRTAASGWDIPRDVCLRRAKISRRRELDFRQSCEPLVKVESSWGTASLHRRPCWNDNLKLWPTSAWMLTFFVTKYNACARSSAKCLFKRVHLRICVPHGQENISGISHSGAWSALKTYIICNWFAIAEAVDAQLQWEEDGDCRPTQTLCGNWNLSLYISNREKIHKGPLATGERRFEWIWGLICNVSNHLFEVLPTRLALS